MTTQTAILLLQTAGRLQHNIALNLAPLELTAQQLKVLHIVFESENQQSTVNEIKANMLDPNSNVSRLLNKLLDKQWIKKIKDQDDQRIVYVKITASGKKIMCQGKEKMDESMACMKTLTDAELKKLSTILSKIEC
ncbi:hypothetical protein TYM08_P3260 [Marinicellulosiphila megalodicopiae]